MRPRPAVVLSVVVTTILLAGCSSAQVIEVPVSAGAGVAPPAPSRGVATPTATRAPLECELALPASVIEQDVGLPAGSVGSGVLSASSQDEQGCAYSIAGNPSAVVVEFRPARLAETFQGAGDAIGATPAPLGAGAYWVEGDPETATPSELAVLAGGYELHLVSHVGDQGLLTDWAVSALAAVGVQLTVV